MGPTMFRARAMERLASPDELDHVLRVTSLPAWVTLAAFSTALLTVLIWVFTGSVAVSVSGQGVFIHEGGVSTVASLQDGTIVHVLVKVGDLVKTGDIVANLQTADGKMTNIVSQVEGTVLEVPIEPGAFVRAGQEVATTEAANEELIAVLYVPASDGTRVKPGMRVQLLPSTAHSEEDGFMQGVVRTVSRLPATDQRMSELLGARDLVRSLKASGPVLEVTVGLVVNRRTPSGFQWSSSSGPSIIINSGTLCTGKIIIRTVSPAHIAMGARS